MGNTEGEDIPMSAAEAREARGEYCLCESPPSHTKLQTRSDLKDINCNIEQLVVSLFGLDPNHTERL